MHDLCAQTLQQLLRQHGRGVCQDPRRLKALLADALGQRPGQHDLAINSLVLALENQVVQDLLLSDAATAEVQRRIAVRLQSSLALTPEVAAWSVAAWAASLGPQRAAASAIPNATRPMWLAGIAGGAVLLATLVLFLNRGGSPAHSEKQAVAAVKALPEWQVIFRSDDPSIWNSDIKGKKHFAMPLEQVADNIRYLRLSNMTTQELVIVPTARERLARANDDGRFGWDGTNDPSWGGRHLGVYYLLWPAKVGGEIGVGSTSPAPRGDDDRGPYYLGWGFGHVMYDSGQGYCWEGKPIRPTVFEIAVTAGPLTEAEAKYFMKADNVRE